MELVGITGDYGRRLSAVVIGFGATARGAVTALNAHGVHEVAVLTTRGVAAVGSPIHSVRIRQFDHDPDDAAVSHVITDRGRVPLAPYLAENDIVVNCTLQDTAAPLTYLRTEDLAAFRPGSLIVDVSCDEGMGFEWAAPTTFDDPMFTVGDHVHYYAVDHSPSYLWNSATWENSEALIPFLRPVLEGPEAWETTRRSAGPSRSRTAGCRTRPSWRSRAAARSTRTPSPDPAGAQACRASAAPAATPRSTTGLAAVPSYQLGHPQVRDHQLALGDVGELGARRRAALLASSSPPSPVSRPDRPATRTWPCRSTGRSHGPPGSWRCRRPRRPRIAGQDRVREDVDHRVDRRAGSQRIHVTRHQDPSVGRARGA